VTAVLRRMVPADLPAVGMLEQQLFGDEAWSREMLVSELTQLPGRYYLAADDGGVIAGYAGLLTPGGPEADVLTIAVAESRWGEGIGAALLEALLDEAALRGCREVFLEVRVDNERAKRLYKRRGFAEVGIRRGYYQPSGTDALVMRLPIAVRGEGAGGAGRAHVAGAQRADGGRRANGAGRADGAQVGGAG
jgi:ribosomal-protein-alanine N-acetyltransferase